MSMGWVLAGLYVAVGIVILIRYLGSPESECSEEERDADEQTFSM